MKVLFVFVLLLVSISKSYAVTDAAQVVGDLKVDGIHFAKDGSTLNTSSGLLVNKGTWRSTVLYSAGEVVQSTAGSFVCLTANANISPPNPSYWSPLGGAQGPTGPAGPSSKLTIGTVTTGAQATASITGTAPEQVLNLTLPQGATGPQGPQGPACSPLGVTCAVGELYVQTANGIQCGYIQLFSDAVGTCISGNCILRCSLINKANCDGITSNGCETDLLNSSANCGSCGTVCKSNELCESGTCVPQSTVYITVTPLSDRLEADVVTGNSCTTGGGTLATETIPIKLTSTVNSNANTTSSVTIDKITISYTKYNPTSLAPDLPTTYDTGLSIAAGTTQTVNVKIASDKVKLDLVQNYGFNLCSADYWQYYATITFSGVEVLTARPISVSTVVMVAFADRNNL